MKKTFLLFWGLFALLVSSCSEDAINDIPPEDGTVGPERFQIISISEINGDLKAVAGEKNNLWLQGYVMPDYLDTTRVFTKVTVKGGSLKLSYADQEEVLGEEFEIKELFDRITNAEGQWTGAHDTQFYIGYIPEAAGIYEISLTFRASTGSTFLLTQNVTVTD